MGLMVENGLHIRTQGRKQTWVGVFVPCEIRMLPVGLKISVYMKWGYFTLFLRVLDLVIDNFEPLVFIYIKIELFT